MFCEIADTCLRSAASTSDIERVFSDCIRSTDNRRHKLRNVLIKKYICLIINSINIIKILKSFSHVGNEGFLRTLEKALPELIKLAKYIHYNSPTFAEMVRLMPEQSNDSDESDPEVRNFLVY